MCEQQQRQPPKINCVHYAFAVFRHTAPFALKARALAGGLRVECIINDIRKWCSSYKFGVCGTLLAYVHNARNGSNTINQM